VFGLLERPEFDRLVGPRTAFADLPRTFGTLIGRRFEGLSPLIAY